MSRADLLMTVILVAAFVGPIVGFLLARKSIATGRLPGMAAKDEMLGARQEAVEHREAVKDDQPENRP